MWTKIRPPSSTRSLTNNLAYNAESLHKFFSRLTGHRFLLLKTLCACRRISSVLSPVQLLPKLCTDLFVKSTAFYPMVTPFGKEVNPFLRKPLLFTAYDRQNFFEKSPLPYLCAALFPFVCFFHLFFLPIAFFHMFCYNKIDINLFGGEYEDFSYQRRKQLAQISAV